MSFPPYLAQYIISLANRWCKTLLIRKVYPPPSNENRWFNGGWQHGDPDTDQTSQYAIVVDCDVYWRDFDKLLEQIRTPLEKEGYEISTEVSYFPNQDIIDEWTDTHPEYFLLVITDPSGQELYLTFHQLDHENIDQFRQDIIEGFARTFYLLAWSDVMESFGLLHGGEIDNMAPETPEKAYEKAVELIEEIEEENETTIQALYATALLADWRPPEQPQRDLENAERFGSDLCHMTVGTGVGWFDDHEKFPLKTSYTGSPMLAGSYDIFISEMQDAGVELPEDLDSLFYVPGEGNKNYEDIAEILDTTPNIVREALEQMIDSWTDIENL